MKGQTNCDGACPNKQACNDINNHIVKTSIEMGGKEGFNMESQSVVALFVLEEGDTIKTHTKIAGSFSIMTSIAAIKALDKLQKRLAQDVMEKGNKALFDELVKEMGDKNG
jgi:hypothetical protein